MKPFRLHRFTISSSLGTGMAAFDSIDLAVSSAVVVEKRRADLARSCQSDRFSAYITE